MYNDIDTSIHSMDYVRPEHKLLTIIGAPCIGEFMLKCVCVCMQYAYTYYVYIYIYIYIYGLPLSLRVGTAI